MFASSLSLIIILPLISTIAAGIFGRTLGASTIGKFTVFCIFTSAAISFLSLCLQIKEPFISTALFGNWFHLFDFELCWSLFFDSISCTMCFVITFISCLVHYYSLGYLAADAGITRFLSYLSLFTFFMLLFVLSTNLIQMFIGWEGVGLVSYLLINFWYDRIPANRAALKAIVMNRIGDFFFILAIIFIWSFFWNIGLTKSYLFN